MYHDCVICGDEYSSDNVDSMCRNCGRDLVSALIKYCYDRTPMSLCEVYHIHYVVIEYALGRNNFELLKCILYNDIFCIFCAMYAGIKTFKRKILFLPKEMRNTYTVVPNTNPYSYKDDRENIWYLNVDIRNMKPIIDISCNCGRKWKNDDDVVENVGSIIMEHGTVGFGVNCYIRRMLSERGRII